MSISLEIGRIGTLKHKSAQYAEVSLFLLSKDKKSQQVYVLFNYKLHLIEDLQVNILIGNNILSPKGFVFNVKMDHAIIKSCRVTIFFKAKQRGQLLKKRFFAKNNSVVPSCSKTIIPLLQILLPDD